LLSISWGGGNISLAVVAVSVLLAWFTYKFIEQPLRFGRNGKITVVLLIFLMLIVGYSGYSTYNRDGLKFRTINTINAGVNEALSYDVKKDLEVGVFY